MSQENVDALRAVYEEWGHSTVGMVRSIEQHEGGRVGEPISRQVSE